MRYLRPTLTLLLLCALLMLTACAKKSEPTPDQVKPLDELRKQAALAFDGTASSPQRRNAADEAAKLLLNLLAQPDSRSITDEDWAQSPRPGVTALVRHLDLGNSLHLYALATPGNTVAERRERLFIQSRSGEAQKTSELAVPPDGRLSAANAFREGTHSMVTLAFSRNGGGGYVAHFEGGADGLFHAAAGAFAKMIGTYGETTLVTKDAFLQVQQEGAAEWQPAFEGAEPRRLRLGPDLTLVWKGQFVLIDDSRFDAFAYLDIAHDPGRCTGPEDCPTTLLDRKGESPRELSREAWQMATGKLNALLQNERSWADDFAGKLPAGGRSIRQQGRDLAVRLLTIPAPEGVSPRVYTAVQWRAGRVQPVLRTVDLPGRVDAYRVMNHQGHAALLLLVESPSTTGGPQTRTLHLLRMTAGNDWTPVTDWIGSIPDAPHWNLVRPDSDSLAIQWDPAVLPNLSVSLSTGTQPAVSICKIGSDCHRLTWVGDRLHSLEILFTQLTEAKQALPKEQLLWLTAQLGAFLETVDPTSFTAAEFSRILDPTGSLGVQVLDAGSGTRLVTMPANPTGFRSAVVHARGQALLVTAHDGFVTRWEGARILLAGSEQRLVLLGRSPKAAVLFTYRWEGSRWVEVDPLTTKVDQILQESARVLYTPGQSLPVRGLTVLGDFELKAGFTDEGVQFCEGLACLTYSYDDGWTLRK